MGGVGQHLFAWIDQHVVLLGGNVEIGEGGHDRIRAAERGEDRQVGFEFVWVRDELTAGPSTGS